MQIVTSFILQWRLHVYRKLIRGPIELKDFVASLSSARFVSSCIPIFSYQTKGSALQVFSFGFLLRPNQKILTPTVSAVGMSKNTTLDEADLIVVRSVLEQLGISTEGDAVEIHAKIMVRNQIIFSKLVKRVKKCNSYTVVYGDPRTPGQVFYGRVRKFLTCAMNSPTRIHLAIIEPLKVCNCVELQRMDVPSEMACLTSYLFTDCMSILEASQQTVAIPLEYIYSQCFDISTSNFL